MLIYKIKIPSMTNLVRLGFKKKTIIYDNKRRIKFLSIHLVILYSSLSTYLYNSVNISIYITIHFGL